MTNQVRVGVSAPGAKGTSSEIDNLRDKFAKMQAQGAKGFAIGVGAAATTAAIGSVGIAASKTAELIGDSIKAASDLNESASKSTVVFGSAAGAMDKFGERASENLGISKQAAIEAGANFGGFFTAIGQSQQAAEGMSETMVTLAGDLASFNNLDPGEVMRKLTSGLTGEAEPLRSVGVFLTEAKVKAKGLELGLADAHGEMSEGAKVMARYKIIIDETKTAQGDFARTADGLANSQRKANAELINAQADFGKYLLPIQLEATKGMVGFIKSVDAVPEALDALTGSLRDQGSFLSEYGDMFPLTGGKLKEFGDQILATEKMADTANFAGKIADDMVAGTAAVEDAAADVAAALPNAIHKSRTEVLAANEDILNSLATALEDGYDEVFTAAESLTEALDDQLSTGERIAELNGVKAGSAVAAGLASTDPIVRAKAQALVAAIDAEIARLTENSYDYGWQLGANYAAGVTASTPTITSALDGVGTTLQDYFLLHSPAKKGPLSRDGGPEGWGKKAAMLYAKGWTSGKPGLDGAAAGVARGVAFGGSPGNSAFGLAGGNGVNISGGIHLHGIGSDVSPDAAKQFAWQFAEQLGQTIATQQDRFTPRLRVTAR